MACRLPYQQIIYKFKLLTLSNTTHDLTSDRLARQHIHGASASAHGWQALTTLAMLEAISNDASVHCAAVRRPLACVAATQAGSVADVCNTCMHQLQSRGMLPVRLRLHFRGRSTQVPVQAHELNGPCDSSSDCYFLPAAYRLSTHWTWVCTRKFTLCASTATRPRTHQLSVHYSAVTQQHMNRSIISSAFWWTHLQAAMQQQRMHMRQTSFSCLPDRHVCFQQA